MKFKLINTILENPQNITLFCTLFFKHKMQDSKSSVNNISSIFVWINPTIHQNMYNRSISLKVLMKATSNINDAIIDKQSSINPILWYLT